MLIDEWLNEVSGYFGSENVADEQGCEMDIRLHTDSSILLKYLSKKFVTINLFQVGQVRDHWEELFCKSDSVSLNKCWVIVVDHLHQIKLVLAVEFI